MNHDDLRAKVRTMRELGVVECDGIKLGPEPVVPQPPPKPRTPDEQSRVSRLWDEYRRAMDLAHVEGVPEEPQEPEFQ